MKTKKISRKSTFESLRPTLSKLAAVVMIIFLVVSQSQIRPEIIKEILELTGFSLLIIAGLGRIWCSLHIAGRKDKVLCQSGPYALCRNPLYFFSFIGLVGFVLATSHCLLALIAAFSYLIFYHFVIKDEELRLVKLFGSEFIDYKEKTNRFFPAFKKIEKVNEAQPVNYRVFEKSLRDVSGFFIAIILVETIELLQKTPGVLLVKLPF